MPSTRFDLENTRAELASWGEYVHRCSFDDGAVPASDVMQILAIAEHLVERIDGTAAQDYDDLGAQIRSVYSLLRTVTRRVQEIQELAGEQEQLDVVDSLASVQVQLHASGAVLTNLLT